MTVELVLDEQDVDAIIEAVRFYLSDLESNAPYSTAQEEEDYRNKIGLYLDILKDTELSDGSKYHKTE